MHTLISYYGYASFVTTSGGFKFWVESVGGVGDRIGVSVSI